MSAQTDPSLTVHTATVRTATIQVRTLTLGLKQVTLAVFRQLYEEPILLEVARNKYRVQGVGWGWVNYCPGKGACVLAGRGAHRHLVWQLGEELRRDTFYMGPLRNLEVAQFGVMGREDINHFLALDDLPQLFIAV